MIANHVARLPGRKNLIWISGGFLMSIGLDGFNVSNTQERSAFTDELERATRAVNSADLAIYPIDTRGLLAMPDFAAATAEQLIRARRRRHRRSPRPCARCSSRTTR